MGETRSYTFEMWNRLQCRAGNIVRNSLYFDEVWDIAEERINRRLWFALYNPVKDVVQDELRDIVGDE